MIQRKREKYESRRQMLFELTKGKELQGLAQDVLYQLSELKQWFDSYDASSLQLETQNIMGADPLMKGKKLMLLLASFLDVDYKERAREKLIQIYAQGHVFPQIISYLIPDQNGITLKYSFELDSDLIKIKQIKGEQLNENYKRLENCSDQTLILVHLTLLNQVIQQRCCFQQFYNNAADNQTIKQLYEKCQEINQSHKTKIIESIIMQISTLYNQSRKQPDQKDKKSEKITHLIFRVLLQLLLQKNIIIPELLKIMKLIRGSKTYNVSYTLGMIVFKPSIKLLSQMCLMNKISNESKQLQLGQTSWSNLPKYETFHQLVAIHFPELLRQTQDQVMEQYLDLLIKTWKIHHKTLILIFKDEQFEAMLDVIRRICGTQIDFVTNHQEEEKEEFENYGANLLKVGTMLFKLRKMVFSQTDSDEIIDHSITNVRFEDLFIGFLQVLNSKKQAFPFILRFIQYKDDKIVIIITDQLKKFLQKTNIFQQYLIKQDISNQDKVIRQSINEEEIISNQIQLLYNHKDVLAQEIKQQEKTCEILVKDLQNSDKKIKNCLVKILVYSQYQISI